MRLDLPSKNDHLSKPEDGKTDFMLKKLEIEVGKQNMTRTLAEQVLNWYIAVIAFISSSLGIIWGLNPSSQISLLSISVTLVGLGIFGSLISMRVLRFIIDYDIKQKVIDAIELYFIKNDPGLQNYLLKSVWPVEYHAFNPTNTVFFVVFSAFNALLTSIGVALIGYQATALLFVLSSSTSLTIWPVVGFIVFSTMFSLSQLARIRIKNKVSNAYETHLQSLKEQVFSL
jgi:hypothetical protein